MIYDGAVQSVASPRSIFADVALLRRERVRSAAAQRSAAALMQRVSMSRRVDLVAAQVARDVSRSYFHDVYWQCLMSCEGSKEPCKPVAVLVSYSRSLFCAAFCDSALGHL